MLENIKSNNIFKVVISHLKDIIKFKLVKYNKSLQNKLKIDLIEYRRFSKKYIIYEDKGKGKGKEFNGINDILIYEGEFLNGERNGMGKIFNSNGKLKFEGEFRHGKAHGAGNEYNSEGELKYIGYYLYGKKNGKGREYYNYKFNKIKFEGEYLNDKRWTGKGYDKINQKIIFELKDGKGYVKEDEDDLLILYEGEYLNGERHGKGKEYSLNVLVFEGEYLNGKRWTGKAYDRVNNELIYELKNGKGLIKRMDYDTNYYITQINVECINGELNGIFCQYLMKEENENFSFEMISKKNNDLKNSWKLVKDKLIFKGEYKNGKLNGKAKEYYINGKLKAEMEFLDGEKIKEKLYDNDNNIRFEGEYLYGCKLKGKDYIFGILEYEGEYLLNRKWNGKGYDKNGNVIYELINGNGKVKEYDDYGYLIFKGEYLNGMRNGKGKEYKDGKIIFEGEYKDGKLIFEGEYKNGRRKEKSYFCFIY